MIGKYSETDYGAHIMYRQHKRAIRRAAEMQRTEEDWQAAIDSLGGDKCLQTQGELKQKGYWRSATVSNESGSARGVSMSYQTTIGYHTFDGLTATSEY